MRIGISSQNFRTITGHAGKSRRFLIYETDPSGQAAEVERLDLPKSASLHEFHGDHHPLFSVNVVVTASCGQGFRQRLGRRGIEVIATAETDPATAAGLVARGMVLPPAPPHEHHA
jgi:predicted Fe-Mo cluster-binding NifX family protein